MRKREKKRKTKILWLEKFYKYGADLSPTDNTADVDDHAMWMVYFSQQASADYDIYK